MDEKGSTAKVTIADVMQSLAKLSSHRRWRESPAGLLCRGSLAGEPALDLLVPLQHL
jgi:hypothetical protein